MESAKIDMMLTSRRGTVLEIIVREYIDKGLPVASEAICRNHRLRVSPATVRNDMAYLEEVGFIARPHISAGAVPLNKAYRYYVESLVKGIELPITEQRFIGSLFQDVEKEFEKWSKLAASLLSNLIQTIAVVTPPKSPRCRFKHVELIKLQEYLTLLVLVLHQTKIKRQFLSVTESVTQEELNKFTDKLNTFYNGLTVSEIMTKKLEPSHLEKQIGENIVSLMAEEDELEYDEPYFDGIRLMLGQPEFVSSSQMLNIIELLEEREWLSSIFSQELANGEVKVVIGEESHEELLHDLSLIYTRYGIPREIGGAIGVLGPTRMDYGRAISSVRYLSEVLSSLLTDVYQ